jgi:hypothetical protein
LRPSGVCSTKAGSALAGFPGEPSSPKSCIFGRAECSKATYISQCWRTT